VICPYAGGCAGLEAFAAEGKVHLAWAFCLGEYGDCDRYKAKVAAHDAAAPAQDQGLADREAILSKLRANFPGRPHDGR
jgi:hypothetical protein